MVSIETDEDEDTVGAWQVTVAFSHPTSVTLTDGRSYFSFFHFFFPPPPPFPSLSPPFTKDPSDLGHGLRGENAN